jgi:hypothetical protein
MTSPPAGHEYVTPRDGVNARRGRQRTPQGSNLGPVQQFSNATRTGVARTLWGPASVTLPGYPDPNVTDF